MPSLSFHQILVTTRTDCFQMGTKENGNELVIQMFTQLQYVDFHEQQEGWKDGSCSFSTTPTAALAHWAEIEENWVARSPQAK